ncbi:hypothetical protein F8M41_022798 [Gigaspora margarita]|uniref:Uncharacterized protein n=1 Tax=Gigaspora margarita TaxID=4874 RepID=A0A8H4AEI6_GIGMA|nr:hypothetical protein F8M41_022798 [Gigaspora margarita]
MIKQKPSSPQIIVPKWQKLEITDNTKTTYVYLILAKKRELTQVKKEKKPIIETNASKVVCQNDRIAPEQVPKAKPTKKRN